MPQESSSTDLSKLLASVEEESLRRWVEEFSGFRHGQLDREELERKGDLLIERLGQMGIAPRREPFRYRGRTYFNVVADLPGREGRRRPLLLGAHFDANAGTPGADDNASGVAALLGAAQALARCPPVRPIRFVGFNLEEPQWTLDGRYRHGSRSFARRARLRGDRYEGVFVLEMVGYTDSRPGSQKIPVRLPFEVPDAGLFLGAVGNRGARRLLARFSEIAARHVPALPVVCYPVPLRGWLLPASRMSDHAPFWDWEYPAVMLTDTAFLRNPHYHQPTDLPETLDYPFLASVSRALIAALAMI